eukprot:1408439-Rhodomonas_salina.2
MSCVGRSKTAIVLHQYRTQPVGRVYPEIKYNKTYSWYKADSIPVQSRLQLRPESLGQYRASCSAPVGR